MSYRHGPASACRHHARASNNAVSATQPKAEPVEMFGPGDVIGIDPRHIIRTEPRAVHDELRAELPLRHRIRHCRIFPGFSLPQLPTAIRLRPWLALIVLKQRRVQALASAAESLACDRRAEDSELARPGRRRGTGRTCRSAATRHWPDALTQRAGSCDFAPAVPAAARSGDEYTASWFPRSKSGGRRDWARTCPAARTPMRRGRSARPRPSSLAGLLPV